jgi:beta-glucosidase
MSKLPAVTVVRSDASGSSEGARVECLLSAMTRDEKIDCLHQKFPDIPRLGLRGTGHVEGLHGLTLGGPGKWGDDAPIPTTTFPQAIGMAQTWDPELLKRAAEVEAIETRYAFHHMGRGGLVVRAPNADLGRDPRWGRTEECYGEDAFLAGTLAAAFVRGLQGDDPEHLRTAALLKHFLANSTEDGREDTSAEIDEQTIREYYARPFEMAVRQGGARCFMAAYNAVNSVPCTIHPLLRMTSEEWGVDGIICTDAQANTMMVTKHKYFDDLEIAAAASVKAGITQFLDDYREAVVGALARGLLTEADLDVAVAANLRMMLRLGLVSSPEMGSPKDAPYAKVDTSRGHPSTWAEHRTLARQVTEKSIVLLKNTDGLLPLDPKRHRTVAVIGPLADRVLGDWYGGTPPYWISPLEGLKAHFAVEHFGQEVRILSALGNDISEALYVARRADVCIVCVGNHPTGDAGWAQVTRASYGKEAVDRKSLSLEDEKLVQEIYAVNPRTVLALHASFPYAIEWSQENLPAIVQLTHASQELGSALARVLCGDASAGGRLVQTWPRSLEQVPPLLDFDLGRGRTYMYSEAEPLYPFGFGLSYTTFAYGHIETDQDALGPGSKLRIELDVTNTGSRDGDEVVQLYVSRRASKHTKARRQLRGFQRVSIARGATARVTLVLEADDLCHWDSARGQWALEEGEVSLLIGSSSSDIRSEKFIKVIGK